MSNSIYLGEQAYFPSVGKITYEGRNSQNPLAFKHYDESKIISGKSMKEHLRFAVCYWHSFCGDGGDPFGPGTRLYPWQDANDPMLGARKKMDAAFEFFTKLGVPYYCFHDRDMSPEGESPQDSEHKLMTMVELAAERQKQTGMKLLWGTANLFSHPRYMNGASTNPNFDVVCHAGAQVKAALDATVALGGENYVFWGGREGYASLLNTNTQKETEHMAQFLTMARDYGRKIGFQGPFLIEPKPMEPMKHQYDFDASTVINFLKTHSLDKDFKLNIEANHATLAGHSFAHELQMSANAGLLGSIDANRGNPQNGWDTDQFPSDLYDTSEAMLIVLQNGGLQSGGLNFDAKIRRESIDLEDMFIAHIGGMDAFARGLEVADFLINQTDYLKLKNERYDSFTNDQGLDFEKGQLSLTALSKLAQTKGEPLAKSGKQEWFENLLNIALLNA